MEPQSHNGRTNLTLLNSGIRVETSGAVANKPNPAGDVDQLASRLPSILQTTLILEDLLVLFQQQISAVLAFDSFHYDHAGVNCRIDLDTEHHHRCHYKLEMNGSYLGDITLSRRHKFNDEDVALFEQLLCLLVYPLRNCLLYKQALDSAFRDDLTGLGNRAAYESSLEREVGLARRQNQPLSLLILDIDNFKAINDSYGHSSGDRALKMLANTIVDTMRRSDVAYRFGGEEFVLLLSNTDVEAASIAAERIRVAISQILCHDGNHSFSFTVSVGIAQLEAEEQSYHLFERADMALYQAKLTGRNTSVCAPTAAAG